MAFIGGGEKAQGASRSVNFCCNCNGDFLLHIGTGIGPMRTMLSFLKYSGNYFIISISTEILESKYKMGSDQISRQFFAPDSVLYDAILPSSGPDGDRLGWRADSRLFSAQNETLLVF